MKKFTKLAVTVAALAALAVGGAAFARAQNASTSVAAPTHRAASEQSDAPDSASEKDSPEGPNDPADSPDQGSQED